MKKFLISILVAMCLMLSACPAPAHGFHGGWSHAPSRGYYHRGNGRFVTGLVVGSLVGAVIAPRYYQPGVVYQSQEYPRSYTVQQAPVYCVDQYGRQYVCQYQTVRVYEP